MVARCIGHDVSLSEEERVGRETCHGAVSPAIAAWLRHWTAALFQAILAAVAICFRSRIRMSLYNFRDFTILIIDDSDFMRNLITDLCRNFGFGDIMKAATVQDAIDIVSQVEVDIVLCDWEMGKDGSTGLDFISFVRNDPVSPNPHLPIIMLSGYTEMWRIQQARDKGATEYLKKPMSAHTVLERICSVIDNPRSLVEAPGFVGPDRRRREGLYTGPDRRSAASAASEDPASD